jgi:hypothetical protein
MTDLTIGLLVNKSEFNNLKLVDETISSLEDCGFAVDYSEEKYENLGGNYSGESDLDIRGTITVPEAGPHDSVSISHFAGDYTEFVIDNETYLHYVATPSPSTEIFDQQELFEKVACYFRSVCRSLDPLIGYMYYMKSVLIDPDSLPGIPASISVLNYFGEKLIDEIGRRKIESTPAYSIEKSNDGFYIRPTRQFFAKSNRKTKPIERHLGMTYEV